MPRIRASACYEGTMKMRRGLMLAKKQGERRECFLWALSSCWLSTRIPCEMRTVSGVRAFSILSVFKGQLHL